MVSAKGEEMYMTVGSSMQFTWQLLGKIEKRIGPELMSVFNKVITGNDVGAGRIGMGGGGEDVGGKGKEKESGVGMNGNMSMDVDSNVNAPLMGLTTATMTNGNGTVVSTSSLNVGGQ
ncbi:hypothetical protein AGABI1DRAFT_110991 [Agaricus bisporus var. burnettii JB137-S8]|uniref:Uncharacterized protein n=1 Tax=Agaricus bisporus var. burnettii (strain JB137-S8 / ATCC MYA-4627 / FGSC 10392) TaxID=597362 RepID=K5XGE3_AGABU|nr:uncharacterized protein AGABI1DRAFT_110991 [Agaricus bisporus var. burnettii JB137-S8]EKM82327.1 hypothetical protein AGABI1DRAFT_110991 [Agaricus bisporus var. burnettii JB137-S8]